MTALTLPAPPLPAYGSGTIADVLPSVQALLPNAGGDDRLGLLATAGPTRRACVHLVDGLGWDAIKQHPDACPTLAALGTAQHAKPIRTCFPSTTVTGLACLCTGQPPGVHGLLGYTLYVSSIDTVVNLIQFTRYGDSKSGPILDLVSPEELQPEPTVFEDLAGHNTQAFVVTNQEYKGSPLSRATQRGSLFAGWRKPENCAALVQKLLTSNNPTFVLSYDPRLDRVGHTVGVAHPKYLQTLAAVDAVVADLIARLPTDSVLVITGDHGMLDIVGANRVDLRGERHLLDGVRAISGEPRIRYLHTQKGAAAYVAEAWRDRFGSDAWVTASADAIRQQWFGPQVTNRVRPLIGDVVVAFNAPIGVFQPNVDPLQARLIGQHGSFSDTESEVPLLVHRS